MIGSSAAPWRQIADRGSDWLRWWLSGLRACVPTLAPRRALLLSWQEGRPVLEVGDRGVRRGVAQGAAMAELAQRLGRNAGGQPLALDVRLPAGSALRKELRLPAAAAGNLREVIGLEMDRETPFRREDVLFAFRVTGRERGWLQVDLAVVPRFALTPALELAAASGTRLGRVAVEGLPPELDLSAPIAAPRPGVSRLLAGLALLLLAVALAGPPLLQRRELAELQGRLDLARQAAAGAERLRQARDGERDRAGALEAMKRERMPATALLALLTDLLPDDAWLEQVRVAGREVRITGYAARAAALAAAIETAGPFASARFEAPVIMEAARGRERFQILAVLREEVRP